MQSTLLEAKLWNHCQVHLYHFRIQFPVVHVVLNSIHSMQSKTNLQMA